MLDDELIARYIRPHPVKVGPEEALVMPYAISVWALVAFARVAHGNLADVAEWYEIPVEAVEAALAYYRRHQPVIDAKLVLNEAALT